jgi:uncharacterized protein (DUF1697 family)
MTTWIALLRGINVSGQKTVAMAALRTLCETLDFAEVRTYIQSGNVVFQAGQRTPAAVSAPLEKAVTNKFGFDVPVIVRDVNAMRKILDRCPYAGKGEIEAPGVYVTLLKHPPTPAGLKKLKEQKVTTKDEYTISGSEIFLLCRDGYGNTKLNNTFFEKQLGGVATTRNWKTMNTLFSLAKVKTALK